VVYEHPLCSAASEGFSRFGASQLLSYTTSVQGKINTTFGDGGNFPNVDLAFIITSQAMVNLTVQSLTAVTNFDGYLDLTDQVAGYTLMPGESLQAHLKPDWDILSRKGYTFFHQTFADDPSATEPCSYTGFDWIIAGPPCSIDAEIICELLDESERVLQNCTDVVDPRIISCTDGMEATGVGFKFLGGADFPNLVWIVVSGGQTGDVYSSVVGLDESFYIDADFQGEVAIEISDLHEDGGGPGQLLERLEIDATCAESDTVLRLTAMFGPLELTAFRNANGLFTSVANARLQYLWSGSINGGSAIIDSEFVDGPFFPMIDFQNLSRLGRAFIVYQETRLVDFGAKFASGDSYKFAMTANATGNGIYGVDDTNCFDEATYTF
jgi:hypothetical protein